MITKQLLNGATTFSLMTFSITAISIKVLFETFSITALSIKILFEILSIMTLSIMTLSITTLSVTTLCHYAECR
jgi:hypothetical protein